MGNPVSKQKGNKMYNNFNPYNPYRQDMFNQSPIQNISQTIPTQAQCFFVSSPKDLEKINPNLNVVYIGINKDKNEIYLRQMNTAGLIDFNTYALSTGGQEKNDFAKIMERIEHLENTMKGKNNEFNPNAVSKNDAGSTKQYTRNGTSEPISSRKDDTTANGNPF